MRKARWQHRAFLFVDPVPTAGRWVVFLLQLRKYPRWPTTLKKARRTHRAILLLSKMGTTKMEGRNACVLLRILTSARTRIEAITEAAARWLGMKAKCFVQPSDLVAGFNERLRDGSHLDAQSTISNPQSYPLYLSLRYSHAGDVPGRQWSTEIGVKQDLPEAAFFCSVLLQNLRNKRSRYCADTTHQTNYS